MPTPYELSLWNKCVGHAGRERHSRHALRRQLPDLGSRRRAACKNAAGARAGGVRELHEQRHRSTSATRPRCTMPLSACTHAFRQSKAYMILTPCPTDQVAAADRRDVLRRSQQRERRLHQLAALPVAQEVPGQPPRQPHGAGRRQGRGDLSASARSISSPRKRTSASATRPKRRRSSTCCTRARRARRTRTTTT